MSGLTVIRVCLDDRGGRTDLIRCDHNQYAFSQRIQDLRELGFSPDKYFSERYHSDVVAGPVHSVLTQEEIDELLTPAGTVWFLSHAIDLDVWEAARLYETGTPWPPTRTSSTRLWRTTTARKLASGTDCQIISVLSPIPVGLDGNPGMVMPPHRRFPAESRPSPGGHFT